jgi:acetyl esterase/lipase
MKNIFTIFTRPPKNEYAVELYYTTNSYDLNYKRIKAAFERCKVPYMPTDDEIWRYGLVQSITFRDTWHIYPNEDVYEEMFSCEEYITPDNFTKTKISAVVIHGSGYWHQPQESHWEFVRALADISGAEVIFPVYPKAPMYTVHDVYEFLIPVVQKVLCIKGSENTVLIGASSGGALALGCTLLLKESGFSLPRNLILLYPWLDISLDNKLSDWIEPTEHCFRIRDLQFMGKIYASGLSSKDFRVSPLYGNLCGLCSVHMYFGTNDILYPDGLRFIEKANNSGIDFSYRIYRGAAHGYIHSKNYAASDTLKEIAVIVNNGAAT